MIGQTVTDLCEKQASFCSFSPGIAQSAMHLRIHEAQLADMDQLASLMRESDHEMAEQSTLFHTGWIREELLLGKHFFILEKDGVPVGCVGFEATPHHTASLSHLCILPAYRHAGLASHLVNYVKQLARSLDVHTLIIAIIGEHQDLQRWYTKHQFQFDSNRHFHRLPFPVTYMNCQLMAEDGSSINRPLIH